MLLSTYYLEELLKIKNGKDHKDLADGNYPVYGSGGLMRYADKYLYDKVSILLPRKGTLNNIQYVNEPFWTVDTIYYTVVNEELVNPYYLYRYLRAMDLSGYDSGASIPSMTTKTYNRIKVKLPSLNAQNQIADIIRNYDELIEVNNQRIKKLEQTAEELYKEWFVRFRFPNWQNIEFENGIPKGWKKRQLKDFINFERGVSYTSNDLEDGGYVLLSMNNIKPYGGFIKDYSRKYCGKFNLSQIVHKNDLIMSITDMTQDRRIIGYTGLVGEGEDNRVISMHLLKLSSPLYDNIYLNCLFNYSGLSRLIAERATGTNVLGMTVCILNNVRCICPKMELVNEFTGNIQPIVNKIHNLESINDNLTKQRDLLLPRLMSGKLEV